MARLGSRIPSAGITKLSELEIDTDKDWLAYLIKNLGSPVDTGDAFRLGDEITDAMHGSRGAITDAHSHDDLAGITTDQHHAQDHATRHEPGGNDAMEFFAANLSIPSGVTKVVPSGHHVQFTTAHNSRLTVDGTLQVDGSLVFMDLGG